MILWSIISKTSTLAALVGYNYHWKWNFQTKKRQEMHAKQWEQQAQDGPIAAEVKATPPCGINSLGGMAARWCQKDVIVCHLLQKKQQNVSGIVGAYVLQRLLNHRTATLRLFDSTVAKLWQTTGLPASPGWFHANRGEYPIVNSHKICETKTKTTHSRNLSSFLHMFDFQRMIDGKATGGCLQLHSIPLDLSLLWQDPPPKKTIWENLRTW